MEHSMRVCIIGENCIDRFHYCRFNRLNPEAPSPCGVFDSMVENPGMAGNVAAHFANLGIQYDFITQAEQIIKTRTVDKVSNYILLRIDSEPVIKPCNNAIDFKSYDFFVISDYCKGFLTEDYISYIIDGARREGKNVYLDTKKILGYFSNGAWIKINEKEYQENVGKGAAIDISRTLVTLGSRGIMYAGDIIAPTHQIDARDVVGAGDTALVFFSIYHHLTRNVYMAIRNANYYAGIACSHKGVKSDFGIKEEDL
jgi:bifunctional ADP-heptose synthase (sugar kinase/adenylyltransferase)